MTHGRVAVVTGAARGIGRATAQRLGRDGHRVVLLDVLAKPLEETVEALRADGLDAVGFTVDLAEEAQLAALPARMGSLLDEVAVLVNNAGISPKRNGVKLPALEIGLEEWERVLRVNLTAPFRMAQLCLPAMLRQRWGRIVNISSRGGRSVAVAGGTHYTATKAGLLGLTRTLAREFAGDGVTVNSIAPGRIQTPMTDGSTPEVLARVRAAIPVGRFGTPEEVAAMVAYLVSEEAGFVTGACFDINGGALMI